MKKLSMLYVVVVLVLGIASFAFAEAKTEPKLADQPMGVASIEAVKITALVESIDHKTREVTLKGPKGNTITFKASDAVKNLDQVKAGDKVVAEYLESVAVFVSKSGEAPSAGGLGEVRVAPKGAKPGVVMVQTNEVTGKVQSVGKLKRTITLMGPDGKTKKFKVDKSVKRFNEIKKGDNITLRVTQALAINVMNP